MAIANQAPKVAGIAVKEVFQAGDGSVRPLANIADLSAVVRSIAPRGVDAILIGLAKSTQGIKIVPGSQKGIIAILIGLLRSDIQRITDGTSNTIVFCDGSVRPGGSIGLVLCDGSVRNLRNLNQAIPPLIGISI